MKKKRFQSLSFKLIIWYILFLGITISVAGLFLYQGFKDRQRDELDKIILEIADETYEEWWRHKGVTWETAIARAEEEFSAYQPFIQLVELSRDKEKSIEKTIRGANISEGSFLVDIRTYCKADRSDIDDLIYANINHKDLDSYPVRMVLFPVRGPKILQVGLSLRETYQELNQLLVVMILSGALLLVLASAGGGLIINRALHPVKSVVKTARRISADDLSLRIDAENRGGEIGELIDTFNDMIRRLEISVKRIRQFSGDVSHELRTPLTIIRGEVEVLLRKPRSREEYEDTLNSVLEESQRMEKIIDDLLFLSRVEGLDKSKLHQNVNLEEVAADVVESRIQTVKKKNLKLKADEVKALQIQGNRDLLERMVANVFDNAVRYTPEGGEVTVTLKKQADRAVLKIADTGIGIPGEDLPKIFNRFYVVDQSRSKETGGSGLGLSIVKWIADCHNAEIDVSSRPGRGTVFTVSFPLSS
jgi:heavy metal sensor kinase